MQNTHAVEDMVKNAGVGAFDITRVLDEAPVGRLMVRVGLLCGLVALLDGTDTTSIGVTASLILDELGLSPGHLGPIFSSALLGAMLGAATFGSLADRLGRKSMLLVATALFSVFTAMTALAGSFSALLIIRFLLGIGLGGAAPCFIALTSEYAPKSHRRLITGLIWTAFPFGVILGAMVNAYLLAHSSWHAVFFFGGALPLAACVAVALWLPESLRFLLVKRPDSEEIGRIMRHVAPTLPPMARIVGSELKSEGPATGLFHGGRTLETVPLWLAFMAAFGMTAATFFWSPILLHGHGISLPKASLIVGVGGGVGSLFGAAGAGRLMEKFGSETILATTFLLATLTTATLGYAARFPVPMVLDVLANAVLMAGISTAGMLALSAGLYPTAIRSTGVGWAMGAGRLGEVIMPLLIGALMVRIGTLGETVFLLVAIAPLIGALSILFLKWCASRGRTAGRLSAT
ncbi:MFS transporter [Lichenicoccus sp.]|uniref:MFS transporter n=1 Tax=Lichenicoccus sp. TaxID=2781899 RepID=UPI003D147C2E